MVSAAKKVAAGGVSGGVGLEGTVGLDRAAAVAGDVLAGIFGGLPWEMSPTSIVDAVTGGLEVQQAAAEAAESALSVAPQAVDALAVVV